MLQACIFLAVEVFPEDEPCFVMKQRQVQQVILEVPSDGSYFSRLNSPFVCMHILQNLFSDSYYFSLITSVLSPK